MKALTHHFILPFLYLWRATAHDHVHVNVHVTALPQFSMLLTVDNEQHHAVDPAPLHWPLVATTSVHLSTFMKAELKEHKFEGSSLKISLNLAHLGLDEDAVPTSTQNTILKAHFVGEVSTKNDNGLAQYMSQQKVNSMMKEAFTGQPLVEFMQNLKDDSTLQTIDNLVVWVALPSDGESVNTVQVDTARGTQPPPNEGSSSEGSSSRPLKIAASTCILAMVMIGSVSLYAYRQHNKRKDHGDESRSKGSDDTSDSSDPEDLSVFSTEYWRDAWAHAAAQVKPRPPRKPRQFKREPSSVRPNLDSIVEEEEDWGDESSWSDGNPLHSYSTMLDVELDYEAGIAAGCDIGEMDVVSPQLSEGSFFKDEDEEITVRPPRRKNDIENQFFVGKPRRSDSNRSLRLKRKDSDEITVARNKLLLKKKEKEEAKMTVAEELEEVRARVLSKEEKKEEHMPPNELAAVHQLIFAKKDKMGGEPVITDELTMMRNRILKPKDDDDEKVMA